MEEKDGQFGLKGVDKSLVIFIKVDLLHFWDPDRTRDTVIMTSEKLKDPWGPKQTAIFLDKYKSVNCISYLHDDATITF